MKPEEKKEEEKKPKIKINFKKVLLVIGIILVVAGLIILSFVFGLWNKKHIEIFRYGYRYDDKTLVISSFEVEYKNYTLFVAFKDKDISLDDFIKKLTKIKNEDDSILYTYDKTKKDMGNKDFYVMSCNKNETIYISKYEENLNDVCKVKYDDLDGISMEIKEGSVTSTGCTIVISNTKNYDVSENYYIQYKNGLLWLDLDTIGNKVNSDKVYKDSNIELKLEWKDTYRSLIKGNYRIVKNIKTNDKLIHNITASFEIK